MGKQRSMRGRIRTQWLHTFKTHMWLQDEVYACFLNSCCQIVELLYLQGHAKVRHWHRVTIDCIAHAEWEAVSLKRAPKKVQTCPCCQDILHQRTCTALASRQTLGGRAAESRICHVLDRSKAWPLCSSLQAGAADVLDRLP